MLKERMPSISGIGDASMTVTHSYTPTETSQANRMMTNEAGQGPTRLRRLLWHPQEA